MKRLILMLLAGALISTTMIRCQLKDMPKMNSHQETILANNLRAAAGNDIYACEDCH